MKKEYNVEVGKRIQIYRKKSNYTQETFAEELNVSTNYVGAIEAGIKGISINMLLKICNTLQVSSDSILFSNTDNINNSHDIEIIRLISNKSDKEKQQAINILKALFAKVQ